MQGRRIKRNSERVKQEQAAVDESKYEYLGRRDHGTIVGRESQSDWESATSHRIQILRLLPKHEGRSGTLCVFGVGDGTSLDLAALLDRFHEVHLVDEDPSAIEAAIRSQDLLEAHRIFRRGGIDMGGVSDLLNRYAEAPQESLYNELLGQISTHRFSDLGEFDCVLSSSVLSVLTRQVAASFGKDLERMVSPLVQIRNRHIELLIDHTLPDGDVFVVTDFVSSDTLPELARSPSDLTAVCVKAMQANNFYPGVNPAVLEQLIQSQPEFRDRLTDFGTSRPWLHRQADRFSACIALRLKMKSSETNESPSS